MVEEKIVTITHLTPNPPVIDTSNEPFVVETPEQKRLKQQKCIAEIQGIFNNGYSFENGGKLVEFIQKQRSLLIEILFESFSKRPDPKMADALNTTLAQMEKSVRDDRKEAERAKELQTSKETFDLFIQSMSAVTEGRITIPRFGVPDTLVLDPLANVDLDKFKIKDEELVQGKQTIDVKPIEKEIQNANTGQTGSDLPVK